MLIFRPAIKWKCRVYDKGDDFKSGIVDEPFMDSNTLIKRAYSVYVSGIIAFARIYTDLIERCCNTISCRVCRTCLGVSKQSLVIKVLYSCI